MSFHWITKSIKVKLVLMFLLAGTVPMVVAMSVIHERSETLFMERTAEQMISVAEDHEQILCKSLDTLKNDALILGEMAPIRSFFAQHNLGSDADGLNELGIQSGDQLAVFQRRLWGQAHHVFLTDLSGQVILNLPRDGAGKDFQDGPHMGETIGSLDGFRKALSSPTVTGFFAYAERDHYHQLVLSPVMDTDGQAIGMVVIEVSIDYLNQIFDNWVVDREAEGLEIGGLYLATLDGHRVVNSIESHDPEVYAGPGVLEAMGSDQPVIGWFELADGRAVYGLYQVSKSYPWIVCVEIDRAKALAPMLAQRWVFLVIMSSSLLIFGVMVMVIHRVFWNPLKRVVVAAEQIADGDLWHEIKVSREDEIGHLEGAVDAMRVALKQQIDHLDALIAERTSELEYANEKLQETAEHDGLTGLANRNVLEATLNEELKAYHEIPGKQLAVLFFDFDRFKVVNDSLGHATGDALLCSIADRFRAQLRKEDLPSRFGGDEFVVTISSADSEAEVFAAADRLLKIFEEPHIIDGHRIVSTASIGLVFADPRYTSAAEMIRDADAAMYEAKLAGKGQIVVFDEKMLKDAKWRLCLEEDLNEAVIRDQLRVMFQPIVELEDMTITGFEALIRWEHPELGIISPVDFIPIAEDTGQIVDVGAWILRESCDQIVIWDRELGLDGTLSINVNVAKRQLIHPDFLATVKFVLTSTGLAPHRLKIEITESTAIDPRHDMSVVIDQIRELGVLIAMDDFGTGHSSLSLLHKFDFDILKIDQSFVQGMEESRDMSAVLHSIIALAQNTGMRVVAEGAETSAQVACLISHGCDMVQGYYFAKPLYASDASEMLRRPLEFDAAA
jgi:diguanylate cyclase (GGDEF)-like protein